jgi:hypothetical protein
LDGLQAEDELPEAGYTAGYARLVNSGREASDPLPGKDPREELAKSVNQLQQVKRLQLWRQSWSTAFPLCLQSFRAQVKVLLFPMNFLFRSVASYASCLAF